MTTKTNSKKRKGKYTLLKTNTVAKMLTKSTRDFYGEILDGNLVVARIRKDEPVKQGEITDRDEARDSGYRPLTTPYSIPNEQWMLDGVLSDLKRDNVEFKLVDEGGGPEVWRRNQRR